MRGKVKRLPAWFLATLSGVLLATTYPTFNMAPLAFASFVPILLALAETRRSTGSAFRLGWLFGFVFFLILLQWIPRLPPENVTVPMLLYPALVLAAAYSALYVGVWAGGVAFLARGRPVSLVLSAPGLWVLLEILRCSFVLGFPWGVVGGSQWAALDWIQMASLGGVHLLSFVIVAINGTLVAALLDRGPRRMFWLAAGLLLIVVPWLHGRGERARIDAALSTLPTVSVALIQPNTGYDKWDGARRTEIITGLVQASLAAARVTNESTLLVWPETATPTLLRFDPPNLALVRSVGQTTGRALFTGFPDQERDGPSREGGASRLRYYNSAGLFLPDEGLVEYAPKARLVPFAEWMPLPGLNRVNFGQSNFTPAESLHVFRGWKEPFGALICIESIFPAQSRKLVASGARFLVNVTNDQWFGDSGAPWQHLSLAVFRSIETRAGMARAANTGVSCIIDPVGRIRNASPLFEPALVVGEVVLAPKVPTFYVRYGDWILVAGLGLAVVGAILARRGRGE
ncbi:MAG: apolipoprotein N-acyltransferase [Candidatus Eisenbacteria bacterium]|nr:apolipoprotein N-acyltransferase [Candidatus Eisenbacteria bacterium]